MRDGFNVVVPQVDIRPHDINNMKCDCGARLDASDGQVHVIHNSWEDTEKMEKSLETIYGSN